MTTVLETVLAVDQSGSPSEALVVHYARLKSCALQENFLTEDPKLTGCYFMPQKA